jgi:hypothetical protein
MASAFTASVASAYWLATGKLALSDLINVPSGLDHFLQLKRRLRNLWHETRDATCKTDLNWMTKIIRKMVRRNATERWERKLSNDEITPHAIWTFVNSLSRCNLALCELSKEMQSDPLYKPKAPTAIHSPTGLKFLPLKKPK